jgi:hypothetical protein
VADGSALNPKPVTATATSEVAKATVTTTGKSSARRMKAVEVGDVVGKGLMGVVLGLVGMLGFM